MILRSDPNEYLFDLSIEELKNKFVAPYEEGNNLFVNGTTISIHDIERVQIRKTERTTVEIVAEIRERKSEARRRQAAAGIINMGSIVATKEMAFHQGTDVLEEFIQGPPGYKTKKDKQESQNTRNTIGSNRIFIVHGHNNEMKETVARFLSQSDLEPIILHEQPNRGKTIIEKFEEYSDVRFAIIILSGDDVGYAKSQSEESKKLRARQNVILEMGYFIGKIGRENVCVLHEDINNLEIPSDYGGVMFIKFNEAWKTKVARELKSAKYDVNLETLLS